MNTSEWFSRKVAKLLPASEARAKGGTFRTTITTAPEHAAATASPPANASQRASARPMRERLAATLRHKEEALSPRLLRRTLAALRAVIDPQISEVEGGVAPTTSRAGTQPPRRRSAATAGC